MTNVDAYRLVTSTDSPDARKAFEEAVHGVAAHRPTTASALARTLAADPDHVAAAALTGFANLILARDELRPAAADALARARRALAVKAGGSDDERILVTALADATDGNFAAAADRLDAGFADRPTAVLPFKLSHALRFMIGDAGGMLRTSSRMLADWDRGEDGAGYLLGCHAFALEEHGRYDEAERAGRIAVALAPDDAWGAHAVGHVHEMRGDVDSGIAWLEASRESWRRCNNFSFHMAWHLSLLHLERGDVDRVLDLYDHEVRPGATDDFRDVANAVSLLWRLGFLGIDVGARWDELAEIARRRRADSSLVFAQIHALAALLAVGDRAAADDLVAGLARTADGEGDQARVARDVGLPLAEILAGHARRPSDLPVDRLSRLGGSNAQRDVFVLALARAAGESGDVVALHRIRSMRRRLKAEDRLLQAIDRQARLPRTA
jgi:tetratricopeptide (TPR) repeat protein